MPHLVLEYTANLKEKATDFNQLFGSLHRIVADVGEIKLSNCKSRAICREDYFVGNGETPAAFVHLDISFLEGRSLEAKQAMGRATLNLLKETYGATDQTPDLQITVRITDIEKATYFKSPAGTLTEI